MSSSTDCDTITSEWNKIRSRLIAQQKHFLWLTARNWHFRDKKCRILTFCNKTVYLLSTTLSASLWLGLALSELLWLFLALSGSFSWSLSLMICSQGPCLAHSAAIVLYYFGKASCTISSVFFDKVYKGGGGSVPFKKIMMWILYILEGFGNMKLA